jgi:hypothetical protein
MALTDIGCQPFPGTIPRSGNINMAFGNLLIDAAGEQAAFIGRVPKSGSITKVGFRVAAVSGAGNADVRLETVDTTTGSPSGTLIGTNTNATQAISAAQAWYETTLTAAASVTQGGLLALVVANSSGAYNVSNWAVNNWGCINPHSQLFAGGSWTKQNTPGPHAFGYNDATYSFFAGAPPASQVNLNLFSTTSTPDERGIKFRFPFRSRVCGYWCSVRILADFSVKLYDSDGSTVLLTDPCDQDVTSGTGSTATHISRFPGTATLEANTFYRLTVLPTTTTNISFGDFEVNSTAILDAYDLGQNIIHTERTDAGAWTDTSTKRGFCGVLIDQIDVASAAIGPGSLAGGFQIA